MGVSLVGGKQRALTLALARVKRVTGMMWVFLWLGQQQWPSTAPVGVEVAATLVVGCTRCRCKACCLCC
eukprot:344686-Chlamydomonas_euryale.AAC.1